MTRVAREALWLTIVSAGLVSGLDAVLLQLQRGFFTGGFLARDSATSWGDRLVFAGTSLVLDAICTGLGVLAAFALAARLQWGTVARCGLALVLGAGPFVLASLLEYQVFARLGDAFDVGLMFDLVGRRPAEFLAVTWTELFAPLAVVALIGGGAGLVLRRLNRRFPRGAVPFSGWRGTLTWLASAMAVIVLTTVVRVHSDVQDNGLRRKPTGQALGALVTAVSDVDRDGHGVLSRPGDPAPFDARIYPFAIDIPGNGIDEDGIGGDLPIEAEAPAPSAPAAFAHTPPVVLVFLETFRADLLGAMEGGRAVTPVLNDLAKRGAAANRAYSHNGYTVQARYHLFTGGLAGRATDTLIDDFRRNGYETAYFSAQDESFGGRAFDIGAEKADLFYDARQDRARRYTTFTTAGSLGVSSSLVLERVNAFLAARSPDRALFLFVNFYDTHFPYWHEGLEPLVSADRVGQGGIVEANADRVRGMYRNAAANVDKAVGALRDAVRAHVGREPAIVVLADHGESLFEEGFLGHGYVLNDVQTRIPLVAANLALEVCEPVGQADIRGAIVAALARPDSGARPTFRDCEGHAVFQYLGTLSRPRQIAFTRASGRLIYDIRDGRVQVDGGPWVAVAALDEITRERWLALVHHWERLRLAGVAGEEEAS